MIIVNDYPTDKSLKIIKIYKDNRIRLIENKKNKGSIFSFNEGIKNAKTKYIAICTQDDIFHPRRFEIQFNYLENNPYIFLIGTSAIYINENGKEIRRFQKYDNYKMLSWRLRKSNPIIFPSIMFRKINLLLGNHYEYKFYYNLLKQGKNLTNIPDFLIKYRVHPDIESAQDKENQEKLFKDTLKEFNELEDNTNMLTKLYYSFKLIVHHLKTRNDKKEKK